MHSLVVSGFNYGFRVFRAGGRRCRTDLNSRASSWDLGFRVLGQGFGCLGFRVVVLGFRV